MQIFITLDYELFLQEPSENIDYSLLEPTHKLLKIFSEHNIKSIFFVDVGYLLALKRQKFFFPKLENDYRKVVRQIQLVETLGHDIGLHIHPHWEDCSYNGKEWNIDLKRYKLADYSRDEAVRIFKTYYEALQGLVSSKIISYRSGGWCLEPFDYIRAAMKESGIYIDSTVFTGGYNKTNTHFFDFRNYPKKDYWTFSIDPSVEDVNGNFIELPSSSHKLSPLLYWRVLLTKIKKIFIKKPEGKGISPSIMSVCKKLFFTTIEPVSIDAYKSEILLNSFKKYERKGAKYFCVIGHPKCFTDLTYQNLQTFIRYALEKGHHFSGFSTAFPSPPAVLKSV